ncbi:MAG: hypothetical protein IAE78_11335 [Myxococcus sp.]|nr:hypothetical protein [Myxococcus sp.]
MSSTNHETIGSDILAVLRTMKSPELILGPEWLTRLRAIDPSEWYPIETLLELLKHLAKRSGHAAVVQMGRQLFRDSHQARLTPELRSAGDVIFGIDAMYHHANRGQDIGGWQVLRFAPGSAVLRKTTPHHCALEEGILHEALHTTGVDALIVQSACVSQGATACEFELRSSVRDHRWMGSHAPR